MKITLSIIAAAAMLLVWYVSSWWLPFGMGDQTGDITVRVINEAGIIVIEDTVFFENGGTLSALLDEHYETQYMTSSTWQPSGRVILKIADVETDFSSTFLHIRLIGHFYHPSGQKVHYNDEPVSLGIDEIPLIDGNIYIFEVRLIGGGN